MSEARSGGCLCGDVRYRLVGEPIAFYCCHCTDCQRQTGSAFGLSMIVPVDALQLERGEPRLFDVAMPDGRRKRGRFCDRCATRLWGEPAVLPQIRVLRPGTLDDPNAFEPTGDIWTDSAQPWVARREDGPQHPRQPQDPLAMVRAWQESKGGTSE